MKRLSEADCAIAGTGTEVDVVVVLDKQSGFCLVAESHVYSLRPRVRFTYVMTRIHVHAHISFAFVTHLLVFINDTE